jgi:hypothetical protein
MFPHLNATGQAQTKLLQKIRLTQKLAFHFLIEAKNNLFVTEHYKSDSKLGEMLQLQKSYRS